MNEDDDRACSSDRCSASAGRYACAKQLLERVIWAHGQHGGLPFTIVRPFNVDRPAHGLLPRRRRRRHPARARLLHERAAARQRAAAGRRRSAAALVPGRGRLRRRGLPHARTARRGAGARSSTSAIPPTTSASPSSPRCWRGVRGAACPAPRPRARAWSARASSTATGYDDSDERVPDIAKARRLLGWRPRLRLARDACRRSWTTMSRATARAWAWSRRSQPARVCMAP